MNQPALPLDTTACERDALRAAYSQHPIKHRLTFEAAMRSKPVAICLKQLAAIHRRKTQPKEQYL